MKPIIGPVRAKATSATLSVSHPHMADQNGVQHLSVEYRRNGEQQWLSVQGEVLEETVTITGLSTFTEYQVRAVAHYPGGVLVNSEPLLIKTKWKGAFTNY